MDWIGKLFAVDANDLSFEFNEVDGFNQFGLRVIWAVQSLQGTCISINHFRLDFT